MSLLCSRFVMLFLLVLQLKSAACFFVEIIDSPNMWKGYCINDTGKMQPHGSSGNLSFLEYTRHSCLDPSAQFRFLDNGAMLNLKRQGCLFPHHNNGSGYDMSIYLSLYVDSNAFDTAASCVDKPNEGIYRNITQTSDGALSVYYKGRHKSTFETWCAKFEFFYHRYWYLLTNYGIQYPVVLTPRCRFFQQRVNFGSVTCHGEKVKNANCPKDQYMLVRFASYRGLLGTKTCGLSDDYSCDNDVTCLVKKQCDGQHECSITVDDNLFSGDLCPGLKNYLYFEYQCVDTVNRFKEPCINDVSLAYSSQLFQGVVQVTVDSVTKNVCLQSLKNHAQYIVCRNLGYYYYHWEYSPVNISSPVDSKVETFSGSINCNGDERYLSQCSLINASSSESCSQLSYIQCRIGRSSYWFRRMLEDGGLLLQDKQTFPDSAFSASASSNGHRASDARTSSGSSWCAPHSDEKHYLQVDLGKLYLLQFFVTYGDTISQKWVATYHLNYTVDMANWETSRIYQGNKSPYDHAAVQDYFSTYTKSFRFIPLTYVVQPCARIDVWGEIVLPDKPTNLTVENITTKGAGISWMNPKNQGRNGFSMFWIRLKKDKSLIWNITTSRNVNTYTINITNLTPFTTYEVSVAAGHLDRFGFGEEAVISFSTCEDAPSGPPLNIKTKARSASSLFFTWDPPEKHKQNGVIVSYTACVSDSEDGSCFQTFIASNREWLVINLNSTTNYYIRVLASTKAGHGNYSENKGFSTNGRQVRKAMSATSSTLKFSLNIPSKTFLYFYVVAMKIEDGEEPESSDSYEKNELVKYAEARKSNYSQPYIAAVLTSSDVDGNMFMLGDGRSTNEPTSRKRRSTDSDYFNGPLEPGTSYCIFQRIIFSEKGNFYSTDWSPVSKTTANPDIDECSKNKTLCSSGLDCINTLGSFECVCNGRELNGQCIKGFKRYLVNLRLNEKYTNALKNKTSDEFKRINSRIGDALQEVYANNDNYLDFEIEEFTNGSIIANLDLLFKDSDTTGLSDLLGAVRNTTFGDFDIDKDALTVVITGTCPSDHCPGNSTCKTLSASTISCPCNAGFYFDGITCKENIVIDVEITLEKTFVEELNNKSSPAYIELENNVTAELTEAFKDTPNFQAIIILAFRNGSVIVEFKVIYRQDPKLNKKVVVAEALKEKIIEGKLGRLKVKGNVKIQGTPPPPKDLKHTDVTENSIVISWNEPTGINFFTLSNYTVSYKTKSDSHYTQKFVLKDLPKLNLVLKDLESDTFYEITVHGNNEEGAGDKVKLEVTTEKPESSVVLIVVIIVVVVAFLLIVFAVVCVVVRKRKSLRHRRHWSEEPHQHKRGQEPHALSMKAHNDVSDENEEGHTSAHRL